MNVDLIAARRTAVVPQGGAFRRLRIEDLAAPVLLACLADAGLMRAQVDAVILSNALGGGGNPARRAALAAGLPDRVTALSLDAQCAGGIEAIRLGAALVASGQAQVVLAGGAESHSRRPIRLATDPDGGPPRSYAQAPFTPWPDRDPDMTVAAAALAGDLGLGRAAQEAHACESHARALAAVGLADQGIVALNGVTRDPFARRLTPALLARLPVLAGTITAATAAVAADAAAFCVIVAPQIASPGRRMHLRGAATLGGDPLAPALSALPAAQAVLAEAGLAPRDLDLAEVMEAYAVQAIATIRALGLDPARVNTGGGALARGHPIGASGAILAVRLFHALRHGPGLACIAGAGGIGAALILQPRDSSAFGRS